MIPSALAIKAELADRSLHAFFRYFAWPVLQPATPFVDNWHIHSICEHLEALQRGQIQKLLVNMPFRMLKSSIISQAYPAWVWIKDPSHEFLTASYSKDIATRDAVESRHIIESAMYQAAFGDRFKMSGDQNVKSRYENDKHGKRTVTATEAGGTGFGGDTRIVDDPISAKEADSLPAIKASIEFWKGTMATRANDLNNAPVVVVHQRVNCDDLTGYILSHEDGWEHLVLPFRYEKKLFKATSVGFHDPRTVEGELIHKERVSEAAAKALEKTLGSYHTKAQLQQNPDPRGGIIFMRDWWQYWKVLPELDEIIMSVDCTFKSLQTSDFVAIQAWGRKGANYYLLPGRIKERMGFAATVEAIRTMAAQPFIAEKLTAVLIEDKANGSAVIESLQNLVAGVIPVEPEGGKSARAYAVTPTFEAGNVFVPDPTVDATIESFIGTHSSFTGAEGGDDDEVDAQTQAINWYRKRTASSNLLDWMNQQAGVADAAKEADKAERERMINAGVGRPS